MTVVSEKIKNAINYENNYSRIIRREIKLKKLAAQIKEELDIIKGQKLDFYEINGHTMSNDMYKDTLVEVDDSVVVDTDKVKALSNWAKKYGKVKSGYSYIQTKLNNKNV